MTSPGMPATNLTPAIKPEDIFLFVATPSSHMTPSHVDAMERLRDACAHSGITMGVYRETGDGIVRARNRAVARFLSSEATHLFFIDDDISFEAEDVFTMLRSGLDVVCGVYPKKTIDWKRVEELVKAGVTGDDIRKKASPLCLNFDFPGMTGDPSDRSVKVLTSSFGHRFVRIFDGPTGFMLIKRGVIERMIADHGPEMAYKADYDGHEGETHHLIFHMDKDPSGSGRYLSEDYWFCRRWQQMGGEIYAFAECRLGHSGFFAYSACLADVLVNPGDLAKHMPAPTADFQAQLQKLEADYNALGVFEHSFWDKFPVNTSTFRGEGHYLGQFIGADKDNYRKAFEHVKDAYPKELDKLQEDNAFGCITLNFDGKVISRDLLDSILEVGFLHDTMDLSKPKAILDIGAGYGRLAHRLLELHPDNQVFCTDGVPVSTMLSAQYLAHRGVGDKATVVPLTMLDALPEKIDIACNIHSWPECTLQAINFWLDFLVERRVEHLMVVPHDETFRCVERDGTSPSFLPAIEAHGYKLVQQRRKYPVHVDGEYPTTYYLFRLEPVAAAIDPDATMQPAAE